MTTHVPDTTMLKQRIAALRGDAQLPPDATIVAPVNAKTDLENVLLLLGDVTAYRGKHTFEIVLVINNYPPDQPPPEIGAFEAMGIKVVAQPNLRRSGEAIGFTSRMHGVRAATTETAILFDADCRVPNATALLDWYVAQFEAGARTAYTHVGYSDISRDLPTLARLWAHHGSRWFKRTILGIPTTRGSNYTVHRSTVLALYDQGYMADEMNVGPTVKAKGGRVVYSGAKPLTVYTSGRYMKTGWRELVRYLWYRVGYNYRVLPVRTNVARYTHRERTDG